MKNFIYFFIFLFDRSRLIAYELPFVTINENTMLSRFLYDIIIEMFKRYVVNLKSMNSLQALPALCFNKSVDNFKKLI